MSSKQEKTNVQSTPKKSTPISPPTKKPLPQATNFSSIPQPPTIPLANNAPPASTASPYASMYAAPQVPAFISVPTPVGTIQVPLQSPYNPYYAGMNPYMMPYSMMPPSYAAYPYAMPMKKKKKKRAKKILQEEEEVVQASVQNSPEDQPSTAEDLLVAASEDAFLDGEFALVDEGSLEIVVADEQEVLEKRGVKRNMEEVMDEILSNERAAKRMRTSDDALQDLDNVVVLDTGFLEGAVYEEEEEEQEQQQVFGERYSAVATFSFGMDEAF